MSEFLFVPSYAVFDCFLGARDFTPDSHFPVPEEYPCRSTFGNKSTLLLGKYPEYKQYQNCVMCKTCWYYFYLSRHLISTRYFCRYFQIVKCFYFPLVTKSIKVLYFSTGLACRRGRIVKCFYFHVAMVIIATHVEFYNEISNKSLHYIYYVDSLQTRRVICKSGTVVPFPSCRLLFISCYVISNHIANTICS